MMTIVTCMYMQLSCVTYDRVRDIEKTCRVHETYINDNNRDLDSFVLSRMHWFVRLRSLFEFVTHMYGS